MIRWSDGPLLLARESPPAHWSFLDHKREGAGTIERRRTPDGPRYRLEHRGECHRLGYVLSGRDGATSPGCDPGGCPRRWDKWSSTATATAFPGMDDALRRRSVAFCGSITAAPGDGGYTCEAQAWTGRTANVPRRVRGSSQ